MSTTKYDLCEDGSIDLLLQQLIEDEQTFEETADEVKNGGRKCSDLKGGS